jgi:glutathione S-transferase
MHAGFAPLRRHFPMNIARQRQRRELQPEVQGDVARIEQMWGDCRTRFGKGGPFLFGAVGAADAMYAPVVSRLHTYDIEIGADTRAYMQAVMALPAWLEWEKAARQEPWILPHDEIDWPKVLKV